jgi:hypothetical protein
MRISYRPTLAAIGLCSILGVADACSTSSSDTPPPDARDAEFSDISRDGENPHDAVATDAAEVDVTVDLRSIDSFPADATRNDVVSIDAAPVDAPLSDRTSSDVSSTDGATADSSLADAPRADSTPADASAVDSIPTDAPSIDSTPTDSTLADAPSGDGGNDPSCPPSYSATGGQCAVNLICVYPEGACECLLNCGPPRLPDAGYHWQCGARGAGCPIQKPTPGSPCSMDAQQCNYGTCCSDWMRCESGQWQSGGILCPP